jgi:4-amino-4-deoxy-L-arabinose transferase-like glycosyltransferase
MFLNHYQHLKNKEIYLLFFLFLFSFLIRIPGIYIFGDTRLDNEWGIIVNNLTDYGKFSLVNFGDFFVPNLFMPPLYAFYLYFFKIFHFNNEIYIQVVLFSQIILSSFSVVIFYNINKLFFSNKICILGTLIFSLFPLHIYACAQISSIILQSFLMITFFYFFLKTMKKNNFYNIFFLSLASGLLILLRGEFIAFFLLSILYLALFIKINLKSILIIILLTFVVISPYLMRNIIVLDTITITKSIGFNLWKGNNPQTDVEGKNYIYDSIFDREDLDLREQINKVPEDKYYEINLDKVFLSEGIKNINNDPIKYFGLYLKKILSFLFIDLNSSNPYYYHPLHYLPVLFISITSIIGIILSKKNSYQINFLILFFIVNIAIVSVFFILPRYKLAIIPLQIIFSNIFFEYIKKNFFKT